jgi:hypothetical protein
MSLRSAIASRIANIIDPTAKNSMSVPLGSQFLRYGNREPLVADWSQLIMNERDVYSGYVYAAIRNRSNSLAQLATESLDTDATETMQKAAKKNDEEVQHPYLAVIDSSNEFSNYKFWYEISGFLDLRGIYFLMAIRNAASGRTGTVKEFKLLNPFNVKRVVSEDAPDVVVGYKETRNGYERVIPPEMIIEIAEFNPYGDAEPYSLAQAAKDPQFTLKQAGDYTRSSLRNNIQSSGIVSTNLVLDPQQMKNFKARLMDGKKGEPLVADGAGGLKWDPMQIDMDKGALDKITEVNLQSLMAVTGMSKTTFGIEVSGVTRETSKVQRDQLVSLHTMPRLQLIIDALNQDFKRNYPADYKASQYRLFIDSPLGVDRDAESKDITNRDAVYNLFTSLVDAGYKVELAAKYADGEITLEELGKPTEKPTSELSPTPTRVSDTEAVPPADGTPPAKPAAPAPAKSSHEHEVLPVVRNQMDETTQRNLNTSTAQLKNAIIGVESQVSSVVLNRVTKNAYDSESDIISKQEREDYLHELELALAIYYGVTVPLFAASVINRRTSEFGRGGQFNLNREVNGQIKAAAGKAANSHMDTILNDLLGAIKGTQLAHLDPAAVVKVIAKKYPDAAEADVAEVIMAAAAANKTEQAVAEEIRRTYGDASFEDLLAAVRKAALTGATNQDLVNAITNEHVQISKVRADVIAQTETNRAFTMAQYEADKQFLAQNDLTAKAYKQLVTRSDNPCPFCLAQAAKPPIPFTQSFANLGDILSATVTLADGSTSVRKMTVNYEPLEAGNVHVRCQCIYRLIIEGL